MAEPVDVDARLDARAHPLRAAIDDLWATVLALDPRIAERWKWNAPSFTVAADPLLTLMLRDDDRVLVVVHHPSASDIDSPLIVEAKADGRRILQFGSDATFAEARTEFTRYVAALAARTG